MDFFEATDFRQLSETSGEWWRQNFQFKFNLHHASGISVLLWGPCRSRFFLATGPLPQHVLPTLKPQFIKLGENL